MEEDKKKIEERTNSLLDEFNEKHKVEVGAIDVDYYRFGLIGEENKHKYANVKLRIRY